MKKLVFIMATLCLSTLSFAQGGAGDPEEDDPRCVAYWEQFGDTSFQIGKQCYGGVWNDALAAAVIPKSSNLALYWTEEEFTPKTSA